MKYKVGDRVKHEQFGEGLVKDIEYNMYAIEFNNNIHQHSCGGKCKSEHGYFCIEEDLKLVQSKFTKSDLKDGDILTFWSGTKVIVETKAESIRNLENGRWEGYLSRYNQNLKHDSCGYEDIIKVERPTQYTTMFETKEILSKTEKEYLRGVIKPWRDKLLSITKEECEDGDYISFNLKDDACTDFPHFEKGKYYKNMEAGKIYSLEELGL